MPINFSLEELTNTLTNWHSEAIKSKPKLKQYAQQIGHDLKSPTNAVIGFSDLFLDWECISDEQKETIKQLNSVTNKYLDGLSLISAYVSRRALEKDGTKFSPITPEDGSKLYFDAIKKFENYSPFLEKLAFGGKTSNNMQEFSYIVDFGLGELVSSGNELFTPKKDNYRIDLEADLLIKKNLLRFGSKQIEIKKELEPVSFKENYVGKVLSYIVNNIYDHAFEGQENSEKTVSIVGAKVEDNYVLTVEDNGIGIDANLFPDPNEIFGDRKSRRVNEGENHGEGLNLVEKFILEQGGSINVENNYKSNGAKFTINLPLENN